MSNIYLKVIIEKKQDVLKTLILKKIKNFVSWSDSGELHLTQISLNFQNFCCNLKI